MHIISIRHAGLTTALATMAIVACGQSGSSTTAARQSGQEVEDAAVADDAAADAAAPPADLATPQLAVCSDGQVAAILHEANQGEIAVSRAVLDRLENTAVKDFAQRMITDHTNLDEALTTALGPAGVQMVENENSRELRESARLTINHLESLRGSELDRSYITHEVMDHLKNLGMNDHLLAPSIKNPALLAVATQGRAAVAQHAQLAAQVQATVTGGQCGGGEGSDGGQNGGTDAAAGGGDDAGTGNAGGGNGGGETDAGGGGNGGGGNGGGTLAK